MQTFVLHDISGQLELFFRLEGSIFFCIRGHEEILSEYALIFPMRPSVSSFKKKRKSTTLRTIFLRTIFLNNRCCLESVETLKTVFPSVVFQRPLTTEFFGMLLKKAHS